MRRGIERGREGGRGQTEWYRQTDSGTFSKLRQERLDTVAGTHTRLAEHVASVCVWGNNERRMSRRCSCT